MAAYIKFDGIDGESLDKDHKGWSDLASFGQALHQPGGSGTGATRRRGDVIMEDLTCSKELDKASPKIAEAVAKGEGFPQGGDSLYRVVHRRRASNLLCIRADQRHGHPATTLVAAVRPKMYQWKISR